MGTVNFKQVQRLGWNTSSDLKVDVPENIIVIFLNVRPCSIPTVTNRNSYALHSHLVPWQWKIAASWKQHCLGSSTAVLQQLLSLSLSHPCFSCFLAACWDIYLQSSTWGTLLSALTQQKPTWAEWVDVVVGPEEQIARQLARIDLLRGGWGRTEGEPATKKVLLLHGMSCGGFLKKQDWLQLISRQEIKVFTPRWLRCFKAT